MYIFIFTQDEKFTPTKVAVRRCHRSASGAEQCWSCFLAGAACFAYGHTGSAIARDAALLRAQPGTGEQQF
jgi:hypothetical protein